MVFTVLFLLPFAHAQYLRGTVVDKDTGETLPGATLYIDGTTVATATNSDGNFGLDIKGQKSDLVISFVGYVTLRIAEPDRFKNKKMTVVLEKDLIRLDEVIIGKGPFSRKQMMRAFKEEFLGTTTAGQSCSILNEEDIFLYFDVTENKLKAVAKTPVIIRNNYLGYDIFFDLASFELQFTSKTLHLCELQLSSFSGTSFFKDIAKKGKANKKRYENYQGSVAHFMQTLANETWQEEQFELFVDGFKDNPKDYFVVKDTLGLKRVTLKIPEKSRRKTGATINMFRLSPTTEEPSLAVFNVLYKKQQQSVLEFKDKSIFIDENGNYSPIFGIIYGGYFGWLKLGNFLPTDYYQTIKESDKNYKLD